jgi:hypothetical protein
MTMKFSPLRELDSKPGGINQNYGAHLDLFAVFKKLPEKAVARQSI